MRRGRRVVGRVLGLCVTAAGLAGCASGLMYMPPTGLTAGEAATLNGPVDGVDGLAIPQKALGFANPDPITLAPGTHTVAMHRGNPDAIPLPGSNPAISSGARINMTLQFKAGQTYEVKFADPFSPTVDIRNVTTGRAVCFDPMLVIYFDKVTKKPIPVRDDEPMAP